ncbi:MAG: GNAT family N-acetyltransferase [Gemmatimonadetes bacterium]|nr:GNAT family N-acetyltransferase [Gemmatimonadota bacterium]
MTLAPLRAEDSATLYEWINDRELVIQNGAYRPVTDAAHRAWFESVRGRADMVIFGIRRVEGDRLIGSCQLHSIHPVHRSAELQIRIGQGEQRGKGFGTHAVRLLLHFAFRDLNLNRVYLHVFDSNAAAIRAYEKAGMVHEGVLRQAAFIDGGYRDVRVMSILAEDHAG